MNSTFLAHKLFAFIFVCHKFVSAVFFLPAQKWFLNPIFKLEAYWEQSFCLHITKSLSTQCALTAMLGEFKRVKEQPPL